MSTTINVAVPLETVAAIQHGTDAKEVGKAVARATQAVIEAIQNEQPKMNTLGKADTPEVGIRMTIIVNFVTGYTYPVTIHSANTVSDLKNHLSFQLGREPEELRLAYEGLQMDNDKSILCYYGVEEGETVDCITRLTGTPIRVGDEAARQARVDMPGTEFRCGRLVAPGSTRSGAAMGTENVS